MKVILVYGPGAARRLYIGGTAEANAMSCVNEGGAARRLHNSELATIGTLLDPRIPATLEEFDLAFPGQQDWWAPAQ